MTATERTAPPTLGQVSNLRRPPWDAQPRGDCLIQVYNGERDLGRSVTALHGFLSGCGPTWRWRIVVADNASSVRTLEVARSLVARFPGEVEVVHLDQ